MEIFGDSQLVNILKWVALAFAAGFVGYFGRYLGMFIIERVRRRKTGSTVSSAPEPAAAPDRQDTVETSRLKAEKKRAKAEAKIAKKNKKES